MTKKAHLLYVQSLYINAAKTIMQKLFDEYTKYINFAYLNQICTADNSCVYINDPVGVFFDALCRKLKKDKFKDETIYCIMSPFHKNDVICGMLVSANNNFLKNSFNAANCEAYKLYSIDFDSKTVKYLQISHNLLEKSKKTQQKS